MVNSCVALNCFLPGNGKSISSTHRFPSDPIFREEWVKFVTAKRTTWQLRKHSRLCSDHFTDDCWMTNAYGKKLSPKAVPTIHKQLKPKSGPLPVIDQFGNRNKRKKIISENDNEDRNGAVGELLADVWKDLPKLTVTSGSTSDLFLTHGASADIVQATSMDKVTPQLATMPTGHAFLPAVEATMSRKTLITASSQTPKRGYVRKRSAATQATVRNKCKSTSTELVTMATIGIQCSLLEPPVIPSDDEVGDDVTDPGTQCEEDDPTWQPPSLSDDEDDPDTESDSAKSSSPDKERKFLVFESCLLLLFAVCPVCSSSTSVKKTCIGTFLSIYQDCTSCSFSRTWDSQPFIQNIPAGNIMLSAAILYSGSLPSRALLMLEHLRMACYTKQTFFIHQRTLLHPVIEAVWKEDQQMFLDELRTTGDPLNLGGDGRADSPGHNAKYGSYTLMELESSKILHVELVQSNEVTSSNAMEKEGLARSVQFLNDEEMEIKTIITDRHLQIQKWIREELPDTIHYYDVWHVAKGLRKKVEALSKEKDCQIVSKWTRSILNHLYWAAASTPDGNRDIIHDKWLSVVNHIQNIHQGHGEHFPTCQHPPLNQDAQKRKWLKPGSKACEKLCQVLEKPHLLRDVRKLSPGHQTSRVEAYHSVINHFAPKMIGFSYLGMLSRLYLAAMHFNENGSREQAVKKNGDVCVAVTYPKYKKGQSVVQRIKTGISYDYADRLMTRTVKEAGKRKKDRQTQDHIMVPKPLSHAFERLSKEEAVARHITRFTRT